MTEWWRAQVRAFRGIRGRVLIWFVGLFAVLLVVGLVTVRQVLLVRLDDEVETALTQEVEELRLLSPGVNPTTGEPFGDDVTSLFQVFVERNIPGQGEILFGLTDGQVVAANPLTLARSVADAELLSTWETVPRPTWGETATDQGTMRWLAVPVVTGEQDRGVFAVAQLIGPQRDDINQEIQVLAVVLFIVLVLASVLGWLAAGRVLEPLRRVTSTAREISDEDLSARIPVESDDEVGELTRTFNDMLERLDEAFSGQRTFFNDLGHELRTPITIVRGHLELLPDDPAERADVVAVCLDELDRMARYVADLVLLAKSQRPDFLEVRPVDIAELTDGLEARAVAIEPDRRWRIARVAPVVVDADPDRLTQAMVNLLANAAQHTGPGGEIRFGSEVGDGEVHLFVTDDGPGVAPEDRRTIFERFGRGSDTATHRREGSGLGLAIVAAIAEAHRGEVRLDSPPGQGATFSIVVPFEYGADDDVGPQVVTTNSVVLDTPHQVDDETEEIPLP
ncbi:sensor histidine kinase [Rhabdothermincola salaria]|uniref:sensor histidine kinase n=1 Tax=Rhabdothermincola salaria TaxID=2903142 RepID=UPI001E2AE251|nr:ATP-binding protein [Rhabdothermincola salaria]MCD9624756.1 ATP-binding protein [Rhabdothermincola salaria]